MGISDVPEKCDSSRARGEALQPTIWLHTDHLSICLSVQPTFQCIGTLRSRTPRMPSLQTWHASTRYLNWHEVIAAEHEFCSSSPALKTLTFSLRHCKKSWFTRSTPWSLSDGRLRAQCNIPNAYKIAMPFSNIFQEIQHTEQREELDITNHELKDGDEECRAGSWNVGVVDKSIRTLFVLQKIWRFPLWMSGARHSDTPPVSTNRDNSTTSNLRAKGESDTKNCAHFTLLSNSPGASQSRPHGYEF